MRRWWVDPGLCMVIRLAVIGAIVAGGLGGTVLGQQATPATDDVSGLDELESLFSDYLHFALIGQFEIADSKYAQPLLQHPDLNPLSDKGVQRLIELTDKYETSIDALLIIIENSSIGDNAAKILNLIRQAHKRKRMDPARINANIKLLAGTPTERMVALERLLEAGEYAIPWMVEVLADPRQKDLHPFVVRALPKLGKRAINPLVEALAVEDQAVRHFVAQALGKIGYPQALAYLQRLGSDPKAHAAIRSSAAQAIKKIVVGDPGVKDKSADKLFNDLAEKYYAEVDSLQADPREDRANVWYLRKGILTPIEVPRSIYTLVMCMRCCESSLQLGKDQPEIVALWLAANFRREARLGLDVESEQAVNGQDLTRPEGFPRSIYYARSAGPNCSRMVLSRAIKDRDRNVALGAISALRVTAGPAVMVDSEAPGSLSLAEALAFPDLLVRIRAALALGQAMPKNSFKGAGQVVPVMASVLSLTGEKFYMVVDPESSWREKIEEGIARTGATVIAGDRFNSTLARARKEFTHLDGIFLASNLELPTAVEAIRKLAKDERFALAPIVLFVKKGDTLIVDRIAEMDKRVGTVLSVSEDNEPEAQLVELLLAKKKEVAEKFGYHALSAELNLQLALESARVLKVLAESGSTVFGVGVAQNALIAALRHPSEELREASAAVLALLDTAPAQRAIAKVALSTEQSESLRVTTFGALAESARRFGLQLDDSMTRELIEQATAEPNLTLRTAASQALGAMNLPANQAAGIILRSNN